MNHTTWASYIGSCQVPLLSRRLSLTSGLLIVFTVPGPPSSEATKEDGAEMYVMQCLRWNASACTRIV